MFTQLKCLFQRWMTLWDRIVPHTVGADCALVLPANIGCRRLILCSEQIDTVGTVLQGYQKCAFLNYRRFPVPCIHTVDYHLGLCRQIWRTPKKQRQYKKEANDRNVSVAVVGLLKGEICLRKQMLSVGHGSHSLSVK